MNVMTTTSENNPHHKDAEHNSHRKDAELKANDWLHGANSRSGKWWYSCVHNVTAMVGAGVLSLPSAMVYLGWGPGIVVLVLSWVITLYTLWQMVEMHEMVEGKRFDRYHELGQHAFGEKLGLWIVVPQQLIVQVGVDIVYMVTGGTSLRTFHDLVCTTCPKIRHTFWIMIFASVHFVLAQIPNFNSLAGVSLAAAVMSLSYSAIAWATSVAHGSTGAAYEYPTTTTSSANQVFGIFNALGQIAFAYAGHNVVLEIQATLPSTPEKPSKVAMWRGVVFAYGIVALCYFPTALLGYWAFGNKVEGDILVSLSKPTWLIAAANLMVVIHVIGSYQLYAMPVFDVIETVLIKKLRFRPGIMLRLIDRSAYVGQFIEPKWVAICCALVPVNCCYLNMVLTVLLAFTCFVAICIPFFGDLLGFFGGFAFAPTTYFLPCIMWLVICKPKRFSLSWITNWFCIIVGILLMLVSSIGGLREIIVSVSTYALFS